jgi:acetoacetyl-CoA synthetase
MQDPSLAPPLWIPDKSFSEKSNMQAYMNWLAETKNLKFPDYQSLWEWSVNQPAAFWDSIRSFYELIFHSPHTSILDKPEGGMIGTRWFEGATVNYAEHIFRNKTDQRPALVFRSERHPMTEVSWAELEDSTARMARFLLDSGVKKGDRVASFLPNIPEAIIAFLATNSIGAIWSSCSPDFGTASVVDRFQQIEPKVLFVADGYSYNGKGYSRMEESRELIASLPTLEKVVFLPYLDPDAIPEGIPFAVEWANALGTESAPLNFEPVAFNDPLWILYSSGTTGKPKAITHSVGGILIEHFKALGLHQNVKPGDRFFWYSTTGWMMWNYANAALLTGGTVVIYDGSAAFPSIHVLWDLAETARINHFGGGASYYIACMKKGLNFAGTDKLENLQSLGSTGSPLPPEAFNWIYECVKSDLWLISLSGGTDICSGFVGGSPFLPVYAGEIQCRMLGCKVEAFNESGKSVTGEVGEMVITQPMPSMPVFFWKDAKNARYQSSYFEMYPGLWRHGDWVRISEDGSLVIYGRSDATLNRGGVRIGTSEVYSAVDGLSEISDSLVVSIELKGGKYYMPLFVLPANGVELDEALKLRINRQLRTQFSPRHVPDEIIQVKAIPYTISGKKMETPVKKILMGMDPGKAASRDAMKNPESLSFFEDFAKKIAQ